MDRGFTHSHIHKLIQYIRTILPSIRQYDQIRSGLRIDANNEDIYEAAKRLIDRISGKLKAQRPIDKERVLRILNEIEAEYENKDGDSKDADQEEVPESRINGTKNKYKKNNTISSHI